MAESLVEALADVPVKRALIPRAEDRPRGPARTHCARAAPTSTSWRCTGPSPSRFRTRTAAATLGADYVAFTSASSVRNFHESAGTLAGPRLVVDRPGHQRGAARARLTSPTSRRTCTRRDGLVAALLADVASRG